MSRSLMLIIAGSLILLSPFAGLPLAILTWILPVLGLIILAIGVSYKRRGTSAARTESALHESPVSASS
ncbi:MAG: hypothetical protein V4644_03385 [Patescibacteria group bacterium]